MKLPFHGAHVCGDIIFASRGGNIHSFSTDGTHISCWKYPVEPQSQKSGQQQSTPVAATEDDDNDGPPAKRVKLENGRNEGAKSVKPENDETAGRKKGKGKGHQHGRSNIAQPSERPMILMMVSSQGDNSSHLVAVTSDKSIWVFAHDGRGELTELSRRTMPKRPCSITLTQNNTDILSADKFGDVYSLPLLPTEDPTAAITTQPTPETASPPAFPAGAATPDPSTNPDGTAAQGPFTPRATSLTVHTARNRKALNDQLISRTNPKAWGGTPKRAPAPFARHLLLGHVSLLTAIALAHDAARRPYIITADRDEHIRVSRGTRAQAHVVERYCMGHEQFVNRLLVAGASGELLLSGGGDGEVLVWRWLEGVLLARADVLGRVREVVGGAEKIALTGLSAWAGGDEGMRIVVICERVPAMFLFILKDSGALDFSRTINLPGNPFEVGVVGDETLVVALDPSSKEVGEYDVKKSLVRVAFVDGDYRVSEDVIKDAGSAEAEIFSSEDIPADEYDKMLYSAETLRKVYLEDRLETEEVKEELEAKDEADVMDEQA